MSVPEILVCLCTSASRASTSWPKEIRPLHRITSTSSFTWLCTVNFMLNKLANLAEQRLHIIRAQSHLFEMLAAQSNVIVNVEVSVGLAVFIQPDQRALHHEEHLHRIFVLIGHQRVCLAGRLVDEV